MYTHSSLSTASQCSNVQPRCAIHPTKRKQQPPAANFLLVVGVASHAAASAAKNRRTVLSFLRKLPPDSPICPRLVALLPVTVDTALSTRGRRRKHAAPCCAPACHCRHSALYSWSAPQDTPRSSNASAARAFSSRCVLSAGPLRCREGCKKAVHETLGR